MCKGCDRTLKTAEWTIVAGYPFDQAAEWHVFQLSVVSDELAFCICEVSEADHDEIDQCPYSATTASKKHYDTSAGLTYIESVDTKASDKETQKQCYKPILATSIIIDRFGSLSDCASTFYANNGLVVYLCATITAIHIISF